MSRLDVNIARLLAQRACLDALAADIADVPGPVVELGLGNGRTFDHLREKLPDREIFVFERQPAPHPDCWPEPGHLIEGDFVDTLPEARARLPGPAALVHADVGTADPDRNARLARWLAGVVPAFVRPGGVVGCDQALDDPRLAPRPLPAEVAPGLYHLYRRVD